MQRTPPHTSPKETTNIASAHCQSDPNLAAYNMESSDFYHNVTSRLKRKRQDDNMDLDAFKSMMMSVFKEFTGSINDQFLALQTRMEEIKEQNVKLQESVDFNAAKYEEISAKLQLIEQERKDDRNLILDLEDKVEQLERHIRTSSLEIRNLPQKIGESKQDLINTMVKLTNVVKAPVQLPDVKDIFRTKSKTKNGNIVVEFTSVLTKDRILTAIKRFNKENKNDRLNTLQLQLEGPEQPIYVSENLTSKSKRLFRLARDFAVQHKYKYCWTSFGKILLRKEDGAPIVRIVTELDLRSLSESKP